ncbi:hypothetical protein SAMN04487782_1367 [Stenotrophomonas maltophilia]|nr:hypothetical protein SAMN04487782_1367 [Stenotrophomonas maltophilia]
MTLPHPTHPRLHALLGDALPGLKLSSTVAEALEHALTGAHDHVSVPAFFARLRGIAQGHGVDGRAWRELRLSEARARDMAEATRCLAAVSSCAVLLVAAQSARETDSADVHCPPQVEEGLLHAVLLLADHAGALMVPAVEHR